MADFLPSLRVFLFPRSAGRFAEQLEESVEKLSVRIRSFSKTGPPVFCELVAAHGIFQRSPELSENEAENRGIQRVFRRKPNRLLKPVRDNFSTVKTF